MARSALTESPGYSHARIALAFALLAASNTARAQAAPATETAPPPTVDALSEADRTRAREHFDRGVSLAGDSRWAEAITELEAARAIRPTSAVHFNLGIAYRAVARYRDAVASYQAYLRDRPTTAPPEVVAAAQSGLESARAAIAHLSIRVEPAAPDAVILVDGARAAAAAIDLDPGRHVVQIDEASHRSVTRAIELGQGQSLALDVTLVPVEDSAQVRIDANVRDAVILIDGRVVSNGSVEEYVRPGNHTIVVRAEGYSTFQREMTAMPGSVTRVRAELSDRRSVLTRPWFWGGAVVVVAGAVVAGVLLLSTTDPAYTGPWGQVSQAVNAR